MTIRLRPLIGALLLPFGLAAWGGTTLPDDPRSVPRTQLLTSMKAKADLNGDGTAESIVLLNVLTGEKSPDKATDVLVSIADLDQDGAPGKLHWARHVARDTGSIAHSGELSAIDLDGDGKTELVLTWDRARDDKGIDRWGEIYIVRDLTVPQRVWEGVWEKDNHSDPAIPTSDREKFRREIDYSKTRREAGRAIVFVKKVSWAAGQALTPPREVSERVAVSLRPPAP